MDIAWHLKNLEPEQMIIIPLVIAAIFGGIVIFHSVQYDSFVPLGIEFAGGSQIEITEVEEIGAERRGEIEQRIYEEFGARAEVSDRNGDIEIETTIDNLEKAEGLEQFLRQEFEEFETAGEFTTPRFMGPELTDLYSQQAQWAAIAAAIAISIIIFVVFRHLTTIGGILSVIGLDILGVLGLMVLFDIPLTLASMGGLLLIIGYAIDDNVLLYNRVLSRVGENIEDKTAGAMKTGLTMAATSGGAILAMNIVSGTPALEQISAVIVMGIVLDAMNTWFFNAGIIMRHAKKKKGEYRGRI